MNVKLKYFIIYSTRNLNKTLAINENEPLEANYSSFFGKYQH
jgi:hypothetical protein